MIGVSLDCGNVELECMLLETEVRVVHQGSCPGSVVESPCINTDQCLASLCLGSVEPAMCAARDSNLLT